MQMEDAVGKRLACGAVAGLLGTFVLQALKGGTEKIVPGTEPPLRQDPGKFMVQQAEKALPAQTSIPSNAESALGQVLGAGYGMSFGTAYAALGRSQRGTLLDGLGLGVISWAAGYLGWLPATGLMSPVWKHDARQALTPIAEHLAYGLTTVAVYHWLRSGS